MARDSTETHFEDEGSLEKPRIIGRLVRLAIGVGLLYLAYPLIANFGQVVETGLPVTSNILLIGILFWVLPYVVNIGWSLNTKRLPQITVIGLSVLLGAFDYLSQGVVYGASLKVLTLVWVLYTAGHLGVCMLLAGLLATPGCEMRSIPHLWTRLTGRRTQEHYCPGWLDNIDRWERGGDSASRMQK